MLDAWHTGDRQTVEAVDRAVDALTSAIGSAVNLVDVDTVLLGGWWINFGQSFYEMLESRLKEQVLGVSDMQVSVSMPPVADHPALYGAAEVGLRSLHRQSAGIHRRQSVRYPHRLVWREFIGHRSSMWRCLSLSYADSAASSDRPRKRFRLCFSVDWTRHCSHSLSMKTMSPGALKARA